MENKNLEVKRVSFMGILCNFLLLCLKLIVGFMANSQAMIADGINSAGDIFSSFMSYIGSKISSKPIDDDHPYGHGKAEYIFSEIIGLSMILAAYSMCVSSIKSIINNNEVVFSIYLIFTCGFTIITKLCMFLYARHAYKKNDSILIKASMEDHRNDMVITCGTIIGIFSSFLGIHAVDGVIGAIISLWIGYVGIKLLIESYDVLMDKTLDKQSTEKIISIATSYEEVLHVDSIKAKPIGNTYIIILKVSMDGKMLLESSHKIAGKIKEDILIQDKKISDVIIHVNPH